MKMKPCVRCHCRQCNHPSTYKQSAIKWGNRRFRYQTKLDLARGIEDIVPRRVSIGYTD